MRQKTTLGLILALAWICPANGAYNPPAYPQKTSGLQKVELALPPEAQAGTTFTARLTLHTLKAWTGPARCFLEFSRNGEVLFVHDSEALESARITESGPITIDITTSKDLPDGQYEVLAGVYLQAPTCKSRIRIRGKSVTHPLIVNTGTFMDKFGVPHRWHVNAAHTLFWDGEPFIPVGGMLIPSDNFDTFKAQVDLLVRYGVHDVYFNVGSSVQMPRVWEDKSDEKMRLFQQCVDYMDEVGMRYGMEPSGLQAHGFAYDIMGGGDFEITVDSDATAQLDKAGDDRWIKEGKLYSAGRKLRSPLYLIADRTTGHVIRSGRGDIVHDDRPGDDGRRRSDEQQAASIDLGKLAAGSYRVQMCVAKSRDGWNDNMYYWSEETDKYFQKIRDLYGKIRMGPGFRFIVDAFWNENNFNHGYVPSDRNFREAYAVWLGKQYGTIERLRKAWAVDGDDSIPDFAAAGRLVPVRAVEENAGKDKWVYLVDFDSGRWVRCREGVSQFRYDLLESTARQVRDYHIRIADLFHSLHDVPVIFKNFSGMDYWHINDANIPGGFDGLGMESYGVGEPMLTFMGIPSFGEVEQSTKTMWLIATEIGEGNHQDQCLSRNKLFGCTSRLGTCYPIYASLLSGGAKGLYHYFLLPPGADKYWEDAMSRDPRQLEWLGTFANIVANAKKLIDYKPVAYYRFPGLMQPNSGLTYSDPHRDYFNTDGLWFVDPAGKLPNGAWLLPTFTLNVPTDMMFINIEHEPASLRHADDVNAFVKSGRRVTWLGYRKDRGTFPQIDAYYTGEFAKNDDGIEFQILKPSATSRVIGQNKAGQVWNLIDGNLQIISKNAEVQPGWRPDRVELGSETHRWDFGTFMTNVLGVHRLNPKDGLEGFSYQDGKETVTVLSLPDAANVVHLGKEFPPYTLDSTNNVLPPAASKAITMVLANPDSSITATYLDGTHVTARAGTGLRIELKPDDLTLIKTEGKFKGNPDGLIFDTLKSRSAVILRSEKPLPFPIVAASASASAGGQTTDRLILIEAERPAASNFNLDTFSALTELSGDTMLGLASRNPPPAPNGYFTSYDFNVTSPGTYQFWVREGYLAMASPSRWKIDDGDWRNAPNTLVPENIRLATLYNAVEDERMIFAWYHYGAVELKAGKHQLTYSVIDKRPAGLDIGLANGNPYGKLLDCFVLAQGEFKPNGRRITPEQVVATQQPTAMRVNLVENPSMEAEAGGWSAFEQNGDAWKPIELKKDRDWEHDFWWTRRVGGEGKLSVRDLMDIGGLQVRQSFCGVRSLRIRAGKTTRRFSSLPISVLSGKRIVLGGYLRTEQLEDNIGFEVRFLNAEGKEIAHAQSKLISPGPNWRFFEGPVTTVPSGNLTAVLDCFVEPGDKGTAWFDDVYLFQE